jgi:hypothetical protein
MSRGNRNYRPGEKQEQWLVRTEEKKMLDLVRLAVHLKQSSKWETSQKKNLERW